MVEDPRSEEARAEVRPVYETASRERLDIAQDMTPEYKRDRRLHIAAQVMAGFAAERPWYSGPFASAVRAVQWADALIAELDK